MRRGQRPPHPATEVESAFNIAQAAVAEAAPHPAGIPQLRSCGRSLRPQTVKALSGHFLCQRTVRVGADPPAPRPWACQFRDRKAEFVSRCERPTHWTWRLRRVRECELIARRHRDIAIAALVEAPGLGRPTARIIDIDSRRATHFGLSCAWVLEEQEVAAQVTAIIRAGYR